MIFPISDDDSKLKRHGWVTILFVAMNVAIFFYQGANPAFNNGFAATPIEITTNTDLVQPEEIQVEGKSYPIPHSPGPVPIFLTIFTAMFMHGSLMHLGSNMLFLWIFGDNVEIRFGWFRFVVFYLVSGVIATMAHILLDPNSVIPSLGASGAIFGVLGAYLVLFPWNKVNAVLFFVKIISVPAILVILGFGALQFFMIYKEMQSPTSGGGVAYAAHIGGLLAGVVLGLIFRLTMDQEKESVLSQNYDKDPKAKKVW